MRDSVERPGGINYRPGRFLYTQREPDPPNGGVLRTNRALQALTEWAFAGAAPWGPVPFILNP